MNTMLKDWQDFTHEMADHILKSGQKYNLGNGMELAHLLSWEWSLGEAAKYLIEIIVGLRNGQNKHPPRDLIIENLMKVAHQVQIAFTKLNATEDVSQ